MNNTTHAGVQPLFTTPTWRRGAKAAIEVFARGCEPNWALLNQAHPELLSGFKTRWAELESGMTVEAARKLEAAS